MPQTAPSKSAPHKTAKIAIQDLTKAFGAKVVLDGVDLSVVAGQSLVVLGSSGTGKSVLIKCILGILEPDSGEIAVDGVSVLNRNDVGHAKFLNKTGVLFQGSALFDSLTVWQNISFRQLQERQMSRKQAREYAVDLLAQVGLAANVANLAPSELSGGMQRRAALARAIASKPDVIFFDEPTTGLDPITANGINDLIVATIKQLGATAVTITHDINSMRRIADEVALLFGGKIIWKGKVAGIDKVDDPYLDQFIHGKLMGPIPVLGFGGSAHSHDQAKEKAS
jgi:phospholipid/cholesterol/gamma-HCH transport system ATP-binding protein